MLADEFYSEAEQDCLNAVLVCDRLGCIDWVNHSFRLLSGYSGSEVIGDQIQNILRGPETKSYSICKINHGIMRGAGVSKLPMTYYHKQRHPYEVLVTVIPVLNSTTKEVDQFIVYQRETRIHGWKRIPLFRKCAAWLRRAHAAPAPDWEPMETQKLAVDDETGLLIDPNRNLKFLESESALVTGNRDKKSQSTK